MLSEWRHKQLAKAILPSRAFYRRLRSRLGTPKAITATAHKLARIFYRLWTNGGKSAILILKTKGYKIVLFT
ncbi:hypothetical protein [Nostoc sp. C117]|uniref:hypothetical protein n=1 Tax=Nostoc sp. C117 TaxID=3349875 RepID=UPI00370D3EEE